MGILLPAARRSRTTPLHCRSVEAMMRRGNLSGELHRALGFLLLLPLVLLLSPPMRQEGASAVPLPFVAAKRNGEGGQLATATLG